MAAQLVGIMMLLSGIGSVFITAIMALGGIKVVIAIVLPIMLQFAPQDEKLGAWLSVPLDMSIVGSLSNVGTMSEEGALVAGQMDFFVTTAPDSYEDAEEPLTAVIFMQEDGAIDEPARYVLRAGPLNYASIFCWFLAFGSLGLSSLAILVLLLKDGSPDDDDDEPEKEAAGSSTSLKS